MKSRSPQAGNVSRGPNPRERCARNVWARPGANGSTLSGSGNLDRTQSVGGGHKPRALAHGYSSSTRQPTGSDEPTAFHAIVRLCLGRETGSRRAWPQRGLLSPHIQRMPCRLASHGSFVPHLPAFSTTSNLERERKS